jgi:hypothetical protein
MIGAKMDPKRVHVSEDKYMVTGIDPQPTTIDITPEWPSTLRWTAMVTAQHGFNRNSYAFVVSLLEMAVKVHHDDPEEFKRILEELAAKDKPVTVTVRPIKVHYHEPDNLVSKIRCKHCGEPIYKDDSGWVLVDG